MAPSKMPGIATSDVDVTHVSAHALWLLLGEEELALPFSEFPWFKTATIAQLMNVERPRSDHLHWPDPDVDLSVASFRAPAEFPLVAKVAS